MTTTNYSYQIEPRSVELSGGWCLRLLENNTEFGGGVFPVVDEPNAGMTWENECSKQEHSHWLMMAASARPTDAYHAYQLSEAYADAESTAYEWLNSREAV